MTHDVQHIPTYLRDYSPSCFLIEDVNLEINLDEQFTIVTSVLTISRNKKAALHLKDLVLDGEKLKLQSIELDNQSLDGSHYHVTDNTLTVLNVPDHFLLKIITHIKPQENTELNGLYKSSGNFCTQCEAQGFRRITYFLDRPDVMARYKTTIIANKKNYPILLSNGNLIASGELDNGKHWATWEDPFKKPSYLFALVAGDLDCMEDQFITCSGKPVALKIFVEKGNLDKCFHAMQAVKKAMQWDEEKFGREYDLDIYMIVAVSDFNMGAMENKGLNIFNTKYILSKPETATDEDFIHIESVIAHEYFHNWTGNRITCRDWFQLSLKEGLTIFRDQSFTQDTTSPVVARIQDVTDLRTTQFIEDAGPLAHPVRPESYIEINNFYTATIYNKGAEVIRMMQLLLGQKKFREAMDLYFTRFDGQAATIEDFVQCMEDASHIDLKQFRLWYSQAGTPVLKIKDSYNFHNQSYTLTINQFCPPTPGQAEKLPFHIPLQFGLLDDSGTEIKSGLLEIKKEQHTFTFENISTCPIPSLLRHFSAPAKIEYDYSDWALDLLFKHDVDLFNRWESGQKYAINSLTRLISAYQTSHVITDTDTGYITAVNHLLKTPQEDSLYLAELLILPSEKYLAEHMQVIDVDAIHECREYFLKRIAFYSHKEFFDLYEKNHSSSSEFHFTMQEVGRRKLKNTCLFYLTTLENDTYQTLAFDQFKRSLTSNMTDTIAALRCLSHIDSINREMALQEFYDQWSHDALVVDKWFSIQAESKLPNTLQHIIGLLKHPAFDLRNPNKVYALIGSFGFRNPACFHAANGEGYAFLADLIIKLDAINPNVAARMVKPLIDWKRYDAERQKLMYNQLEHIVKSKKLSTDVYELVTKSLN